MVDILLFKLNLLKSEMQLYFKFSPNGLFFLGGITIFFGVLIQSPIFEILMDIFGWGLIILGIFLIISGVLNLIKKIR